MLESLLAFGCWTFWVWFAGIMIILLFCVETQSAGWATISVIASLGLLQYAGYPIWLTISTHPLTILPIVGAYVAIGIAWAFCRWYFYVKHQRYLYDEYKNGFLKVMGVGNVNNTIPENLKYLFNGVVTKAYYYSDKYTVEQEEYFKSVNFEFHPTIVKHKASIYIWLAYWPWSFLWTLINDPLRKMFRYVYEHIKGTLQRISDHAWAGTENDLNWKKKEDI
jgi:hypothetical protein